MKILVTGSSGMIGTSLVSTLRKKGHKVVGLDIRKPQEIAPNIFIKHDLRKPISLATAKKIGKIDTVIHLAAHARVYDLVIEPDRALENIVMTHHILEFARAWNSPRVLFASSRESYGKNASLPVKEDEASQRHAQSPYAASKLSGEAWCYAYRHCYKIDARIVRFSNVYGRNDVSDRFIPKAIRVLKKNKPLTIYGKNKSLDFIHLDDAVAGVLMVLRAWNGKAKRVLEFNIASGEQAALLDVAKQLRTLLNSASQILLGESLPGEVATYQADIQRMRNIGWKPRLLLKDGLARALAYYHTVYE